MSNTDQPAPIEPEASTQPALENEQVTPAAAQAPSAEATPAESSPAASGPLNLQRIREARLANRSQFQPLKGAQPRRDGGKPSSGKSASGTSGGSAKKKSADGEGNEEELTAIQAEAIADAKPTRPEPRPASVHVEVPSLRAPLPSDLQAELDRELAEADLDQLLIGETAPTVGQQLEEGSRLNGKVLKVHGEHVFVSLGGPDEGVIPILQFEDEALPEPGATIECLVRGFNREDGLYELSVPGTTISVSDWSDLEEGAIVEAKVTGVNQGGLECTVGSVRGFMPAGQVAEYRIEDFSDFVDQKLICVVTEANARRGNLVLSRRAILERERAEKREALMAQLEVGQSVEGLVRKVMDFGAFVDLGGVDGLLHVSQLSWERVTDPRDVVQEGQKIQVRIDKIDAETGKISLSYKSLQEHPWAKAKDQFQVGSVVKGSVTRIATFGAFVRIAPAIEGLIHISELAHRRVSNVASVVQEGQEVEVKILSIEPEQQRISLSLKAMQAAPKVETPTTEAAEPEVEEPLRPMAIPKHSGPLKGGLTRAGDGDKFGLKW